MCKLCLYFLFSVLSTFVPGGHCLCRSNVLYYSIKLETTDRRTTYDYIMFSFSWQHQSQSICPKMPQHIEILSRRKYMHQMSCLGSSIEARPGGGQDWECLYEFTRLDSREHRTALTKYNIPETRTKGLLSTNHGLHFFLFLRDFSRHKLIAAVKGLHT